MRSCHATVVSRQAQIAIFCIFRVSLHLFVQKIVCLFSGGLRPGPPGTATLRKVVRRSLRLTCRGWLSTLGTDEWINRKNAGAASIPNGRDIEKLPLDRGGGVPEQFGRAGR